jgi:hypothetical protein
MLRRLTMLKKAVIRLVRRIYTARKQYPECVRHFEHLCMRLHTWLRMYAHLWSQPVFQRLLLEFLQRLRQQYGLVRDLCAPETAPAATKGHSIKKGKKGKKGAGSRTRETYRDLCGRIEGMLRDLDGAVVERSAPSVGCFACALETALRTVFEAITIPAHAPPPPSQRGVHTVVFPSRNPREYGIWIADRTRVKQEVVAHLGREIPVTGHAPGCACHTRYRMKGFRGTPRKCRMIGGQQAVFRIRMVECLECGQCFSLLPSFLAREKQYALEIIGHVVEKLTLFGQSLSACLKDLGILSPGGHSKQTPLEWVRWFGALHPAEVLTRAGIQGTGYFQEDEGFEKEAELRTYTVAMVEPQTLVVWHLDYVDHVDEATLCSSFEDFVRSIDLTVLGVTKDKWAPSTTALKRVFHGVWIAFCHRHCLQKFRQALTAYQAETGCSNTTRQHLYQQFKRVLTTSESGTVLRLRVTGLSDKAFHHPLLRAHLDDLTVNASRYTCHQKRHGLTPTTSIVDNFLKQVKRKLRQVESFRDQASSHAFFRAMATVRNFVPFLSGAKHAHQSPFMLAKGETFDLPWVQVMNVPNAFLLTGKGGHALV